MTFQKILAATAFGLVAACSGTAPAPTATGGVTLSDEASFRAAVVGRTVDFNGSTFTINADGTMSGPWNGDGLTGTWTFEDGAWCRTVVIGGVDRGLDCQTWVLNGDGTATVTRDRGAGNSFTYTLS